MAALLNPKLWAALAVALALGLAGAFMYRAGKAVVRNDFDAYKLAQQEARILADRAQRIEEQRRAAAVTKEASSAQIQIATLEASLPVARAASDGVRDAATGAAGRARANSCSTVASARESGGDPLGLLVDVLGRADQRAGELAEYADRLRIAGIACERSYDALTQ